jgi:hypothetical protein
MVIRRIFWVLVAVAILGAVVAVTARASRAEPAADACLSKPNAMPPQGSHWYYRSDRTTNRRCWYLAPLREKASEAVSPRRRLSARSASRPTAEPPAEALAPANGPMLAAAASRPGLATSTVSTDPEPPPASPRPADGTVLAAAVPWLGLPASTASTDPEPASASPRPADEPSTKLAQNDLTSTSSFPTAADPAAETSMISSEDERALIAIALAIAVIVVRKLVRLLAVRRLRRRRQELRAQWEGGAAASGVRARIEPEPAFATAMGIGSVDDADDVHSPPALPPRPIDFPRRPVALRATNYDLDDHAVEDPDIEQSLQRLLADWRRAAA